MLNLSADKEEAQPPAAAPASVHVVWLPGFCSNHICCRAHSIFSALILNPITRCQELFDEDSGSPGVRM